MMKGRSEFVAHLGEVFEDFGAVSARPMFGGYGVYHEGLMFGLVADDVLYLKADRESEHHFLDHGLQQFEYFKNGKPTKMSYFMAPADIYDNRMEARKWATRAFEAALRNKDRGRSRNKAKADEQ